jgi:hypothetical protein
VVVKVIAALSWAQANALLFHAHRSTGKVSIGANFGRLGGDDASQSKKGFFKLAPSGCMFLALLL